MKTMNAQQVEQVSGGAHPAVWAAVAVGSYVAYRVGKSQGYSDNADC